MDVIIEIFKRIYIHNICSKIATNSFFHQIFGIPGAVYVCHREGEAFHPDCVVPTVKFEEGSVMVWGCMASSGTGMLYTCEDRMNSTIYTNMLDQVYRTSLTKIFNNNIPSDVIFQQDNAPCHTSKVSIGWFEKKGITVMKWPLNPQTKIPLKLCGPI